MQIVHNIHFLYSGQCPDWLFYYFFIISILPVNALAGLAGMLEHCKHLSSAFQADISLMFFFFLLHCSSYLSNINNVKFTAGYLVYSPIFSSREDWIFLNTYMNHVILPVPKLVRQSDRCFYLTEIIHIGILLTFTMKGTMSITTASSTLGWSSNGLRINFRTFCQN